ncbi:MAG: glucose-1-phosphate cytidylyltransferase [Caldilinea sp. CFX5]|nr:glucose-1-phosphate cytidylyltransferase [Caldilinea sp. CFX5]
MKVVLFCGGLGTRLREYSETIPKPMVEIGYRPIIWHLMKYYAHFGHCDFILCLGYRGDYIKRYFLSYDECLSNDFVMSEGGRAVRIVNRDISDWTITFVDTGLHVNIGQRLKAVQPYLAGEDLFMANYADGLTNLNLADYITFFQRQNKIASFLAVRPSQSFHQVTYEQNGLVTSIRPIDQGDFWINGGFFIFRNALFEYMAEGEELVVEPFQRLIADQQLIAYQNPGFWACMDTFKEKKLFDDMYEHGNPPWAIWEKPCEQSYQQINPKGAKINGNFVLLDRSNVLPQVHTEG